MLTAVKTDDEGKSYVKATLERMSDEEALKIANLIQDLTYDLLNDDHEGA